jgi:hypothetical protein
MRGRNGTSEQFGLCSLPGLHPGIPVTSQVNPVWILTRNERYLLLASPSLQLCLAGNSFVDVIVGLPVEQACYIVLVREPFEVVVLMLEYPLMQVPAESDVQRPGKAPHDVHAVIPSLAHANNCGGRLGGLL